MEGTVNLGGREWFWFALVGCPGVVSGRCRCPPDSEGPRSQESVIRRSQQMASYSEKIRDDTNGLASRFESAHLPFSGAGRPIRGLGAIVRVTVASWFVGNDTKWLFPLASKQLLA